MGSRVRLNPDHIFECFCEIASPSPTTEPWILQKFPENFNSQELLNPLPQFAHPCPIVITGVQHFSFVLTNLDGKWTYGFCRHAPDSQTSLCILSYLPWHETFYKVLNFVAELANNSEQNTLWKYLQSLYDAKIPSPHAQLNVSLGTKAFTHVCPDYSRLPSIPENRNLTEYFNAVDAINMITIFASMLCERRILITSKRLNRLSACVQAANSLIYPMHWQHIFIPVLPSHLLDYLSAPMPFLIGVPAAIMSRVQKSELGEAVILNADENKIYTGFDDLHSMPSDIVASLKKKLKNPQNMLGEGVAHAFMRALVHIIGGYRDALRLKPGEQITFSDEAFLQTRSQSLKPFLEKILQLQIFRQFIEDRLDKLNSGNGFSDEFEFEVNKYSERNSIKLKTQYREWVTNRKKEGGAFLKTVKSKANPAVKHAVKSVKDKSKRAYKDFRTKIHELQIKPTESSDFHLTEDDRQPRSAPTSPTAPRAFRPQTAYNSKDVFMDDNLNKNISFKNQQHMSMQPTLLTYDRESSDDRKSNVSEEADEDSGGGADDNSNDYDEGIPEYKSLNMDLMGDLQDIIFRKCSMSSSSSSPSVESKPYIAGTQSMNELKIATSSNTKAGPPLLIKLESTSSEEFDPLKSSASPISPGSDNFTLDILRELDKPSTSSNQTFPNSFGPISSSNLFSPTLVNPSPPQDTKILSAVPILQPTSTITKPRSETPTDPFADLVNWDKKTTTSDPKTQWHKFD